MLSRVDDWAAYLSDAGEDDIRVQIFTNFRAGRPLGDALFVRTLERITGRVLSCRPSGRKKKPEEK